MTGDESFYPSEPPPPPSFVVYIPIVIGVLAFIGALVFALWK